MSTEICPYCGNTDSSYMDSAISTRCHCLKCSYIGIHAHVISKYDKITKKNIFKKLLEIETEWHGLSTKSYLNLKEIKSLLGDKK